MKVNQLLLLGALTSSALAVENVLKVPLKRVKYSSNSTLARGLGKRDGTYSDSIDYDYWSYFADVQVGTPSQTIRVLVDTGSSDLWFPTNHNPHCPEGTATPIYGTYNPDTDFCLASAQFDTDASSTWDPDYSKPEFHTSYGDGGYAYGVWGSDTVEWNGASVKNMYFAAANDTTKTSILGIGKVPNESSNWSRNGNRKFQYPNWPARLKEDGYIAKNAYSLYPAENPYTTSGDLDVTLLFGGIDNAKYTGSLATVPITSNAGYSDLAAAVTSMVIHVNGQATTVSSSSFNGVLDSGTTYQNLPVSVTSAIATSLGSTGEQDEDGFYIIPCDGYSSSDYISYRFGSKHIHVPVSAVVNTDYNQCTLSITPTDTYRPILGDSFLINAYVFYDIDDNEISLAQASYSSEENIQAVT